MLIKFGELKIFKLLKKKSIFSKKIGTHKEAPSLCESIYP